MTLKGKLVADVVTKIPAEKMHDLFSFRLYLIPKASPQQVRSIDLLQGEWGKEGSKILVKYFHDGALRHAKEIIASIDHKNYVLTFRIIEGDLMELYKTYDITYYLFPKDEGCVVHWVHEYERLHEGIVHPHTLVEFDVELTKRAEAYLLEEESKKQGHDYASTS